MIWECF